MFTLPNFNCTCNSYRLDPTGTVWSKILINQACQWYVNSRVTSTTLVAITTEEMILHFLRVPKGTDIAEGDLVQVNPGEDFNYQMVETERVHLNFPNEYAVAFCNNMDKEFLPYGPIETELQEDILTEGGSEILTELT